MRARRDNGPARFLGQHGSLGLREARGRRVHSALAAAVALAVALPACVGDPEGTAPVLAEEARGEPASLEGTGALPSGDACATMAPHEARTLGGRVHAVRARSGNASYAEGRCGRFVVDVEVPAGARSESFGSTRFFFRSGREHEEEPNQIEPPGDAASCRGYEELIALYMRDARGRKPASLVLHERRIGVWDDGLCRVRTEPMDAAPLDELAPPRRRGAVYRYAVSVTVHGKPQPLVVEARHVADDDP